MKSVSKGTLLLLLMVFLSIGAAAEEFFSEETFSLPDSAFEESLFTEEGFFGDDPFFAPEEEEGYVVEQDEEDLSDGAPEARSIISLFTDQLPSLPDGAPKWMYKPRLSVAKAGDDAITLSWVQEGLSKGDIPGTVRYYLYAVDRDTGVAKQVGKPFKAKALKAGAVIARTKTGAAAVADDPDTQETEPWVSAAGMGGSATVKNLPTGKIHTYFVCAENLTGTKKMAGFSEEYGLSSDVTGIYLPPAVWKTVRNLSVTSDGTGKVLITWQSGDIRSFATEDLGGWEPTPTKAGKKTAVMPKDPTIGAYIVKGSLTQYKVALLKDAPVPSRMIAFDAETETFRVEMEDLPGDSEATFTVEPWKDGVKGNPATAGVTIQRKDTTWKFATVEEAEQTDDTAVTKAKVKIKGLAIKESDVYFTINGFSSSISLQPKWEGDKLAYHVLPAKKLDISDYPVGEIKDTDITQISKDGADWTVYEVAFTVEGPVESTAPSFSVMPYMYIPNAKGKPVLTKGFTSAQKTAAFDAFWTLKPEVEIGQEEPGTLKARMEIDTAVPYYKPGEGGTADVDSANWPDTWTVTGFADKQIVLQKSGDTYIVQKGTVLPSAQRTGPDPTEEKPIWIKDEGGMLEIEFVSNMKGPKGTFTVQAAKGKAKGASSGKIPYTLEEYWTNAPEISEAAQTTSGMARVSFSVPKSVLPDTDRFAVGGFKSAIVIDAAEGGTEGRTYVLDPAANKKAANFDRYSFHAEEDPENSGSLFLSLTGPVKTGNQTFSVLPLKKKGTSYLKGTAAKRKLSVLADAKSGVFDISFPESGDAKVTFSYVNPGNRIAFFNVSIVTPDPADPLGEGTKVAFLKVLPETADGNATQTVAFEGVTLDKDTVYSVFVETYLTDGSRMVDAVNSLKTKPHEPGPAIPIDGAHFPDENFRSFVSQYDSDLDGYLSELEIKAVNRIDCDEKSISDLTGIGYFTALQTLYCRYNDLTGLDVSGCSALEDLFCSGNQLTALDLTGCSALQSLVCSGNRLTALDVSGCSALKTLFCHSNLLEELNVTGCSALQDLYCSINELTELDVSGCSALEDLFCSDNQLTALDVSKVPALADAIVKGTRRHVDISSIWEFSFGSAILQVDMSVALTPADTRVEINETNFSDDNFRSLVKEKSIDSDSDGWLNSAEIAAVTRIDCTDQDISDLTGIGYFTALKILDCYDNFLTALDVSGCSALQSLDCSHNHLTALDLTGCSALQNLDCNSNQLTKLDVSGCSALQTLYCEDNQLRDLSVTGCSALQTLYCDNNKLPALDVSGCSALQSLDCDDNQLTALDVSGCSKLGQLYCHFNNLTELDLSSCRTVADTVENGESDTDGNTITYTKGSSRVFVDKDVRVVTQQGIPIDDDHFPDGNFRSFVGQYDKGHDGYLSELEIKAVNTIDCSSKSISDLTGIVYFTALQTLKCSDNDLSALNVSGCSALQKLDCRINTLSALNLTGCSALENLVCDSNQLTKLDVTGCSALLELDCGGNYLTELNVSSCSALQTLDCYENELTELNVSDCYALENLDCSHNQLTELNVSSCSMLQTLECSWNQLTKLDVTGRSALTSLDCYENQLTKLAVSGCSALKILYCYENQLTALDLTGCSALQTLYCSDNQLTELDVSGAQALADAIVKGTRRQPAATIWQFNFSGAYLIVDMKVALTPADPNE